MTALDGLHDIQWDQLQHAFGPAGDVPALIEGLASPAPEIRRSSLSKLYGNIWHQGTVYEATAYVVPFVIRLVDRPEQADQPELLSFLSYLATGSSYLDVHAERKTSSSYFREMKSQADYPDKLARELTAVKAAHDTVAAGRNVYENRAADSDWQTRAAAIHLFGRFPEWTQLKAWLLARAVIEPHVLVRATIWLCLVRIGDDAHGITDTLQNTLECSSDLRERYAAAWALTMLMTEHAPTAAKALVRRLAQDEWIAATILDGLPWDWAPELDQDGLPEPTDDAPKEDVLPEPSTADGVSPMLAALSSAAPQEAAGIAAAIIHLAFPDNVMLSEIQWNANQCRAARQILDNEAAWIEPKAMSFLFGRGVMQGRLNSKRVVEMRGALEQLYARQSQLGKRP